MREWLPLVMTPSLTKQYAIFLTSVGQLFHMRTCTVQQSQRLPMREQPLLHMPLSPHNGTNTSGPCQARVFVLKHAMPCSWQTPDSRSWMTYDRISHWMLAEVGAMIIP